jgi:hypothetical protein
VLPKKVAAHNYEFSCTNLRQPEKNMKNLHDFMRKKVSERKGSRHWLRLGPKDG